MMEKVRADFPALAIVATTLRNAKTATVNDWGAIACADGKFSQAASRVNLEIHDRVGGGDSFASGLFYGLLSRIPGLGGGVRSCARRDCLVGSSKRKTFRLLSP